MIDVQMPKLGESVAEGTVTRWHVKEGDVVQREQPLLEVATDKADSEVPSPADGVVAKIAVHEGDVVPTGALLCSIDDKQKGQQPKEKAAKSKGDDEAKSRRPTLASTAAVQDEQVPSSEKAPLGSPSTRKLARDKGVDLGRVLGTGERGRITRDDVARAAREQQAPSGPPPSMPGAPPSLPLGMSDYGPGSLAAGLVTAPPPRPVAEEVAVLANVPIPGAGYRSYKVPPYVERPGDKIVPFTRRRRITADHMVYSQHVSPHVVAVAEIDMYATAKLRDRLKGDYDKAGVPLTYLTFVVAAVVKALGEFPTLNARVLEDSYVVFKDINVGVAIDTPQGLIVANVKQADSLSLRGIATGVDELAKRARDGKITADDLMGTTFAISNPGRKGNLFGGAIISQPNVAILRIGEIKKRPVVVTVDGDDHIVVHPVMFAALSYDHRIVDGVEANGFLWRIADILQRAEVDG
jgi:pyruvate/2-oxoglutarate dehydrogenase complex dihydrolipoamide acyltransferase (E2) component